MGGQARARRPKLRVERRPFLASKAVIFGVNFTGPYILDVTLSLYSSGRHNPCLVIETDWTNSLLYYKNDTGVNVG